MGMDAASSDDEIMMAEYSRKRRDYLLKLHDIFKFADLSGDGTISEEEFDSLMESPEMLQYLQLLGLEVHESVALFELLDDGDGCVTYEEFVAGASRLKGQARSLDLMSLQRDI